MFTCERCGKEFTEKTNLTRHMKTPLKDPTVSGQTYSCGVCDKVFSVSALGLVLVQVLLVSSSVVSACPLVSRGGHNGVLRCPFC
jgi:uncharacterized Zn-finger protein